MKPLSEVELLASRVDSATGNGMGAYAHYKEYSQLVNRLKGEEINKAAQSEKFQKEFERQKTEQDKRNEEAKRIKNQQLFTIIVLALVLLTILIIAFLLWKNNTQKQKANLLLRSQKEKIETTLSELKATQAQLIQSEKMASLGQLTAGIAHEIQNPLNFVNNFSDINKEIITEMSEALKQGNYEEASLIASDIRENEIKINQHGKRADAIIKGMLQHSRSGAGQKEPTDINALADEYLRLSYHGFLARNPSFNAILKTRFDGNIGKTNIIPQDMGKVLLNIYNNSFYAVSEKINQHIAGYEPTVIVNTKKAGDKIEITITDNGTGIPPNLVDKIFQPFFTTKPTGQGTGLGLSLAYDITKAHGGDLKAASVAGEGSDFMIILPA